MSKKGKRRAISPRKHKQPAEKSGSKQDNLPKGFKPHDNALEGSASVFIGKVK